MDVMSLLQVRQVTKHFPRPGGMFASSGERIVAVDGVDFDLSPGDRLGVVGESGCGKTTLGRLIAGLYRPDSGQVRFDGQDVHQATGEKARELRRRIQMVWQDTAGALDPRLRVGQVITEPLMVHGLVDGKRERDRQAAFWLDRVGLDASLASQRPHELSGGQRQRVGLARALAPQPDLLIADEPVASLDVSVQTQILRLLADRVADSQTALLFISHDLRVVRALTRRVLVLFRGRPMELGPTDAVSRRPLHPYTQTLMAAIPALHPDRRHLREAADETDLPPANTGCLFSARCPLAEAVCRNEKPAWRNVGDDRWVACHLSN